jgi:hypothetical protein
MEKELSDREANALYWKDINEKCKLCKNICRQSNKSKIIKCAFVGKDFEKIK